jgi:hypothetical protein
MPAAELVASAAPPFDRGMPLAAASSGVIRCSVDPADRRR